MDRSPADAVADYDHASCIMQRKHDHEATADLSKTAEAHIFARSERARDEPSAKKDFETEYSAASLLQVRASLSS